MLQLTCTHVLENPHCRINVALSSAYSNGMPQSEG